MTPEQERTRKRLEAYRGGTAELGTYATSHKRLAIRLAVGSKKAELVLSPLTTISGPVEWKPVDIVVRYLSLDTVVVEDVIAGFRATCGGVSLLEGLQ
jgi:hypothetical protein